MANHIVTCGECGRVLDEPPDARPEARQPCPACGSLRRSVAVNLGGSVTRTSSVPGGLEITLPLLSAVTVYPPTVELARKTLAALTPVLYLIPPSPDSASWYCQVEEGGEVIDVGMASDIDEALLNAAVVLSDRYRHFNLPPNQPD